MDLIPHTVAIAGFGTVGYAVARVLTSGSHPTFRLTHILNRQIERKKVDWVPSSVRWTDSYDEVLGSGVDILVELVGGLEPAEEWIRRALEAGIAVVTANKQVIAHRGPELAVIAAHHRTSLRFEAAVAGGIPVIRAIQEGLAGDRLTRIAGILNGTCNYILSRMGQTTLAFGDALREARALGYAEADPTDDLDGADARAKLTILAAVGLHRRLAASDIPSRSITGVDSGDFAWATRLRSTIRQVSWVEIEQDREASAMAWVSPALVAEESPFAGVQRNQNLVITRGERGGETVFGGLGAGGDVTAVAVVSDLLTLSREREAWRAPLPLPHAIEPVRRDFVAPHYLRLRTPERAGSENAIRKVLAQYAITVDRTLQVPQAESNWSAVLTLAPCQWRVLDRAMAEVQGLGLADRPVMLPIIETVDSVSAVRAGVAAR